MLFTPPTPDWRCLRSDDARLVTGSDMAKRVELASYVTGSEGELSAFIEWSGNAHLFSWQGTISGPL